MRKHHILSLLIILLICTTSYPQQSLNPSIKQNNTDSTLIHNDFYKLPRFDIHIGAGKVNGLRVGSRILLTSYLSFETSVGIPLNLGLINILGFQSALPIISLGINGRLLSRNITISLLTTFLKEYNKNFQLSYISPNIGIMEFEGAGTHFFIRMGPYFEVNSFRFGRNIGLNIDFGINLIFN